MTERVLTSGVDYWIGAGVMGGRGGLDCTGRGDVDCTGTTKAMSNYDGLAFRYDGFGVGFASGHDGDGGDGSGEWSSCGSGACMGYGHGRHY